MSKIVIAVLENMAQEMVCSKKTVYKWIRERDFPAFKFDGVWRVMPRDLEAWFAAHLADAERCASGCATRGARKASA
ncbi:helix-turn-helix domain-containing protein [Oceanidesulfovibrio marinus]|uniref:Helix-turn-helix domain-containing protein n=1 Tax=Oceanidesulfovibrio marinus TaxID=370038 RepID=A0A6P1ZBE7_9BACT|nr:helix-turn-helix domain-containing protein [Oceanidesulfovibrio marinus]TVM27409.1 hypothetical protein DQK91_22645 [Oceanidesulfovibrio marinus]